MVEEALPSIELAEKLTLLLALAFFLGLAFEELYKQEDPTIPGGIRTFPLIGLAGAMLFLIEPRRALAFTAGLLAIARADHVTQPPWLAVGLTGAAVLVIGTREKMHGFVRAIPQDEVLTAGKFLVLAGIILALVPDTLSAAERGDCGPKGPAYFARLRGSTEPLRQVVDGAAECSEAGIVGFWNIEV
jgi:hypothetical protein